MAVRVNALFDNSVNAHQLLVRQEVNVVTKRLSFSQAHLPHCNGLLRLLLSWRVRRWPIVLLLFMDSLLLLLRLHLIAFPFRCSVDSRHEYLSFRLAIFFVALGWDPRLARCLLLFVA